MPLLLLLLLPSRVITRSGSIPASRGPHSGGRAGERSECFSLFIHYINRAEYIAIVYVQGYAERIYIYTAAVLGCDLSVLVILSLAHFMKPSITVMLNIASGTHIGPLFFK